MSNTAKLLEFPRRLRRVELPRDTVADQIRKMLESDCIPPQGSPERTAVVAERRAYYKQLLGADAPKLTQIDWTIIFANTLPE